MVLSEDKTVGLTTSCPLKHQHGGPKGQDLRALFRGAEIFLLAHQANPISSSAGVYIINGLNQAQQERRSSREKLGTSQAWILEDEGFMLLLFLTEPDGSPGLGEFDAGMCEHT